MRLYIIRHADPDYEHDDLTEAGQHEAEALGAFFERERLDEIYSSPLGRARRTASYAARARGLTVAIEDWAREIHELLDPASKLMVWDYDPNILASLEEEDRERSLAGKAWRAMPPFDHPRLLPVLDRIEEGADGFMSRQGFVRDKGAYRIVAPNAKRVALFCHNGSGLTMLAHFLRIPPPLIWSGFFMNTSSVTTILFEERRPGVATARCIGLSELTHLRIAGLREGSSGLKANLE